MFSLFLVCEKIAFVWPFCHSPSRVFCYNRSFWYQKNCSMHKKAWGRMAVSVFFASFVSQVIKKKFFFDFFLLFFWHKSPSNRHKYASFWCTKWDGVYLFVFEERSVVVIYNIITEWNFWLHIYFITKNLVFLSTFKTLCN